MLIITRMDKTMIPKKKTPCHKKPIAMCSQMKELKILKLKVAGRPLDCCIIGAAATFFSPYHHGRTQLRIERCNSTKYKTFASMEKSVCWGGGGGGLHMYMHACIRNHSMFSLPPPPSLLGLYWVDCYCQHYGFKVKSHWYTEVNQNCNTV